MANTPRLFHISDDPTITVFTPRPHRTGQTLVWAIGEPRLHNYLLPRQCPRVTFFASQTTCLADHERFLNGAKAVVAIEGCWFERCLHITLYSYELDPTSFSLYDDIACYYTTLDTVYPQYKSTIERPLSALIARGVELRVLPSLWELHDAVAASTLGFSMIRMRNAIPRGGAAI